MDGFGNIGDVLGGVRDAVTGIGAGAHQALEDILSHTNGVDSDIGDLQSRTQALEGVIGYINTYCSGGFSMSAGDMFIPMNVQVGPSVGVVYSGNTVYLASKGLWVADVNMNIDYLNIGTVYTNAQVRVYAPNGSLHAQRIMESDTGKRHSLSCHLPFVVPSSGYYVQVWANAALGRGFKGGSIWNGLSVEKRSSETS